MFFFLKQKTAYEMRISDGSSDVCSSDLIIEPGKRADFVEAQPRPFRRHIKPAVAGKAGKRRGTKVEGRRGAAGADIVHDADAPSDGGSRPQAATDRSEEHTSELQSLMRISYAVFCLKKKKQHTTSHTKKRKQAYTV